MDLSRIDRKAQGPLELVSYWSLLVPLQATHLSPIGKAQKAAQLDNWLDTKGKTYRILLVRNIIVKWCRWVYVTLKFFLFNQLRVHTSWALVELEWRLRVFPSASIFVFEIHRFKVCYLILEFWNLHSVCYRLWMK